MKNILLMCDKIPLIFNREVPANDIHVRDVVKLDIKNKPDRDGIFVRDIFNKLIFIYYGTMKFRRVYRAW